MKNTAQLKKASQYLRKLLNSQVEAKLSQVLQQDSRERREFPKVLERLEKEIKKTSREIVVEKVAYTWFNRFIALRFMDVNNYNNIKVVTPPADFIQPEILVEAKQGHIDDEFVSTEIQEKVFSYLKDSDFGKAYKLLLISVCNAYNKIMPFLFEKINDYTELLLPDDLLSGSSSITYVRENLRSEECENVEVIGWLYQYYISEKKDQVFEGLKKNKKITPENIPAATQLFTPNWIVRYLVENSLGRLWMLNNPNSKLVDHMEYYIKPEDAQTDFLKIEKPEELKVCDPACGSGHMLVYAFDILYKIYEECGYEPKDIPELILTHNLYGIEIDERAGELASFALCMKARKKYRRFFRKPVQPNICILEKVEFSDQELIDYRAEVGNIFSVEAEETVKQFAEVDNVGSLIIPHIENAKEIRKQLEKHEVKSVLLHEVHERILTALKQAEYLSSNYHVVVANPPYMGGKGMNPKLKDFAQKNYPDTKSDLFAMFIERGFELIQPKGYNAMVTMQSWMFLSSYEKMREQLLSEKTIVSMAHLGPRGFDSIGGEVVQTTAFVNENFHREEYKGQYLRLIEGGSEAVKSEMMKTSLSGFSNSKTYFKASASDFKKIPGSPIAYWLSKAAIEACQNEIPLSEFSEGKSGMSSCNSALFLRNWYETNYNQINRINMNHYDAKLSSAKWYPYNKGGGNRRWYGYNDVLINWEKEGADIKHFVTNNPKDPNTTHWSRRLFNLEFFFQEGLTWSAITSGRFSLRYLPYGVIPGTGSKTLYDLKDNIDKVLCFLNSNVASMYLNIFSPTLNYEAGDVGKLPILKTSTLLDSKKNVDISKADWDSYETSWDFTELPILKSDCQKETLPQTYTFLNSFWKSQTLEMQKLEEENNRIFIKAYGLEDELTPEVPLREITLTCNPHYRYSKGKSEEELEALLLADTMKEFISYGVACMFGRYSIDKPGLILANQGETVEEYLKQIPKPRFMPDDDNVIPILDADWFPDDITDRFRQFLKITFDEKKYAENLAFIEDAIGKDLRKYFVKDFYNDHVRRYKKRPIYWMFSSPKGSFNALIYMHRYSPDTASLVLNEYLRAFIDKLNTHIEHLNSSIISEDSSDREKTKAIKEIDKLKKVLKELNDYEKETLFPLASKNIEIDLDDGVKVNYAKFGSALKKIKGLNG